MKEAIVQALFPALEFSRGSFALGLALREQMITGASRARRKQVTAAFEGFGR